jgi:hypothetical protein
VYMGTHSGSLDTHVNQQGNALIVVCLGTLQTHSSL